MANVYEDSDWSVAQATGQKRWLKPFPESNDNLIFEQDYTQSEAGRLADLTQMGSVHPDDATFYLVAESTPSDMGGGMVRFTRTYSKLPPGRTDFESFAFTFPGMATGVSHPLVAVSGNTATTTDGVTTITTTSAHSIAVGDSVRIHYNAFDQVQQYSRYIIRTALTGTTGSTLKVDQITDTFNAQPLYFFTVQKVELGRDPITETVASKLTYDYFLAGVSAGVASDYDIQLIVKDVIIDGDGLLTDTYTDATTPAIADYRQKIADGEWIVAEDSVIRRWRGPILERVTRYVKAK
jgi:hypothetical protein